MYLVINSCKEETKGEGIKKTWRNSFEIIFHTTNYTDIEAMMHD